MLKSLQEGPLEEPLSVAETRASNRVPGGCTVSVETYTRNIKMLGAERTKGGFQQEPRFQIQ